MYKDKDGFECDGLEDIVTIYESEVICPCCGDVKDVDDVSYLVDNSVVELECLQCECVFKAEAEMKFSTVCKKYRTDGKVVK